MFVTIVCVIWLSAISGFSFSTIAVVRNLARRDTTSVNMKLIGLTGGICAGKSNVSTILKSEYGCVILDADKYGHEAYKKDTACYNKLVSHFGPTIVTEERDINRKELGKIVFSDKSQMRELERIVWPEILVLMQEELARLKAGEQDPDSVVVVIEAAIMIEADWHRQLPLDSLWVIQVPVPLAKERLMARNGLTPEDADKRIASQMTNEERAIHANILIENTQSNDQLVETIKKAYETTMSLPR